MDSYDKHLTNGIMNSTMYDRIRMIRHEHTVIVTSMKNIIEIFIRKVILDIM